MPEILSQARNVKVALPLKLTLGTKRILWVLPPTSVPSSSRAVLSMLTLCPVVALKSVQLPPLSVENCHLPLVWSTFVTAMASTALAASVIDPSTTISATVLPLLAVLSSSMAVSTAFWSASTGA